MKLTQLISNGAKFLPKRSCWLGPVTATLQAEGKETIRFEVNLVLSHATDTASQR